MTNFEDRLLDELKADVAAPETDTARKRRFTPARVSLGATAVAGVAAAVSVPLAMGTPAYAIEKNDDGTLTVAIDDPSEHKAVQEELRDKGARVVVDYVPEGKECKRPAFDTVGKEKLPRVLNPGRHQEEWEYKWTIDPTLLDKGETLVIEIYDGQPGSKSGQDGKVATTLSHVSVADGPVEECDIVDK